MVNSKNNLGHNKNRTQPIEKLELVHSGEDYFQRLLKLISNAQTEIHLQTYIFENDSTGIMIINALKEAVTRNVKVYLFLDAYGSSLLSWDFVKEVKAQGINIRFFSLFFSTKIFHLGRRLHHKIAVADKRISLIGGINIADNYRGSPTQRPWLDYAVQIECPTIGKQLQQLCKNRFYKRKRTSRKKIPAITFASSNTTVGIIQNDWLKLKNEISNAYIRAIRNATKEVTIVGSYFLPGRKLKKALKIASKKGVKIKLILFGISDVPLIKPAISYLYAYLLKENIELYEWNKSILHGKAAVVDQQWATIGSFNLNHLSSYGSIEMNVEINSPEFSKELHTHLESIISQCELVTSDTLRKRNRFFTNILNWLAYLFVRIGLKIITYVPNRRFTNVD